MPTDTKLNQLIINQLTQEQYDEAKAAGTLSDTELYITDSDDDPQVKSNLSQTIDDSTTKYPSNKAVKDESSRITTLMNTKVSNCITKIPQDIKLELNNNNTIVLKKESKVYVPNGFKQSQTKLYAWLVNDNEIYYTESETPVVGDKTFNEKRIYTNYKIHEVSGTTLVLQKGSGQIIMQVTVTRDTSKDIYTLEPKFDTVTITQDVSDSADSKRETLLFYRVGQNVLEAMPVDYCFSSPTAPSIFLGGNYAVWYDTTNNVIKLTGDGGSTWNTGYCFPICLAQETTTTYSISQVFNGFGYIGWTIYAFPGVKGLVPNGRNADGSLRSIEFTLDKVYTFYKSFGGNATVGIYFDIVGDKLYVTKDIESYDEENNLFKLHNFPNAKVVLIGNATVINIGRNFSPFATKKVFHALDYSDKSTISGWSKPSSRYINLSVAASGSAYTAPANGYFSWYCYQNNNGYIFVQSSASLLPNRVANASNDIAGFIPVKKGDIVMVEYANLTFNRLRFIYAEGEN